MINFKEIFKKNITLYICVILICILFFGFIYGFRVLNPNYVDWIFADAGDISQHYVGWKAYRLGAWTFPVGVVNTVSYPTYISVIHTDSIPLLAFLFKLVSFCLPKTFQYLGLYGLICFVLQGIFSFRILRKYVDSKLVLFISMIFFMIVPSMLFRMFYHTALASHWLIILALETIYLYDEFRDGKKIYWLWGIISFLTVTVHLYYLVMCGIILVGYIVMDIINSKKIRKSIILLGIYILVALITLWIFGGFVNLGKSDNFGFGLFSYNLNGLINSQGYSFFVSPLPMLSEQYEGFSYLGLGVIILSLIALFLGIRWFIKDGISSYKGMIISFVVIGVLCTFVALSPQAYFGEKLIYDLKLPKFILNFWGTFRSTGRFIWPLIYIITITSIVILVKRLKYKTVLIILSICALVQVRDMWEYLADTREYYSKKVVMNDKSIIKNTYMNQIGSDKNISLLVLVSKDLSDSDKIYYADWALSHGKSVNKFHFARQSFDDLLLKNTKKYLNKKSDDMVFLFTTKRECLSYELNCYKVNNNLVLGYVKELG